MSDFLQKKTFGFLAVFLMMAGILQGEENLSKPSEEPAPQEKSAAVPETVVFSLPQCVEYALEHSPSLAKQDLTRLNQKLETLIQKAQFDPVLTAADSQLAQEGENSLQVALEKRFGAGFTLKGWMESVRHNGQGVTSNVFALQLSKMLLGGGSRLETEYDLKASLVQELVELNQYEKKRRELIQDVKIAYYTVIEAQQSLLVKQRALRNAERTLQMTQERENPLDILTAKLRIPDNELSVNSAERTIRSGLESLKQLMGMPVDLPFSITGDFDYRVSSVNLQEDLEHARENIEQLVNNRLERRKLEWQAEIYRGRRWPKFSVSATLYQYGDGDGFNTKGDDEQVFSANLSWDLGRRADKARWAKVKNQLISNQHDYFILDQELQTNLTNYYRKLQEGARAVELQEEICQLNRQKEELYLDKWENGEIDILELVRTQTDMENAQVTLITEKISYLKQLAYYECAAGK